MNKRPAPGRAPRRWRRFALAGAALLVAAIVLILCLSGKKTKHLLPIIERVENDAPVVVEAAP